MHKDFWNSNKIRALNLKIFEQKIDFKVNIFDEKHNHLNTKSVEDLINKKIKSIGKLLPISEDNIKKKLLIFIKKNRVAMRTEQSCCRFIKQFDTAAFLYCDTCNDVQNSMSWMICKNCGSFNKFKI